MSSEGVSLPQWTETNFGSPEPLNSQNSKAYVWVFWVQGIGRGDLL